MCPCCLGRLRDQEVGLPGSAHRAHQTVSREPLESRFFCSPPHTPPSPHCGPLPPHRHRKLRRRKRNSTRQGWQEPSGTTGRPQNCRTLQERARTGRDRQGEQPHQGHLYQPAASPRPPLSLPGIGYSFLPPSCPTNTLYHLLSMPSERGRCEVVTTVVAPNPVVGSRWLKGLTSHHLVALGPLTMGASLGVVIDDTNLSFLVEMQVPIPGEFRLPSLLSMCPANRSSSLAPDDMWS